MKLCCLLIGLLVIGVAPVSGSRTDVAGHRGFVRKCWQEALRASNRSALEMLHKVRNYANWTSEEIPCFARCVAGEIGWFDIDHHKWNKQRVLDDLGENMFNYCRYEFSRPFDNVCTYAFKGLKCLKQAEAFVGVTYRNLLQCVQEMAMGMSALLDYYHFPQQERIPCLFKCFADKANLYTDDYSWNVVNWVRAFGPIRDESVDISVCRASAGRRSSTDVCAWMYEEYNCWERLNYNTNGSVAYAGALKRLIH